MTRFARMATAIPGPRSQALVAEERVFLAPGTQALWQLAGLAMDHGEGALLRDVDGNTFVDFVAGICVASLGHGHPALASALGEQAARVASGSFTTAPRVELLRRLAAIAPSPKLKRTQLYSGGAEAVESALRLARAHTKKFEVLAFWGGFHGKTGGVLGLMGSTFKQGLGPTATVVGGHLAPYADCARCPLRTTYPGCGLACVDFVRDLLRQQTTGSLAAILVEPIQGTAGNIVPPPEWLPAIAGLAREQGALLVLDEMITGFGRTGKMFGAQHFGVEADIMTFGKGVAAGYPVTGLMSSDEIVGAHPWSHPSFSSSSYGGGALGAAAANAVTRVIVEEHLEENARLVGDAMRAELHRLEERYPFVANVRGQGLMLGFDLVKDRKTKELLDRKACQGLYLECLKRGLISMTYTSRVRLNPPLVITREQALEGMAILDEALSAFAPTL